MGYYANPPQKLTDIGREIEGNTYQELTDQLQENEVLFGLYGRIAFMNAVHLYSENEYNEFESQDTQRIGFFAVVKDDLLPHEYQNE